MDLAHQTAKAGGLVIWEEVARDGAQAKTLMRAEERVAIAQATGALFGEHGPSHVIFAAGFPAISTEEVEVMRVLAEQVDNCALAHHGRARRDDIDLGIRALQGARHPRLTFFIPASARMAAAMGLGTPDLALKRGLDILAYALDKGGGIPVDIAITDIVNADPGAVAHLAMRLRSAGASIIKLCDSIGAFYPESCRRYFETVFSHLDDDVVIGVHQHNDLGFAHANNLEAIKAGARVVATSWLGLAERNGLGPTEQFLFALAFEPENHIERLGYASSFWLAPPNLRGINPIAQTVGRFVDMPLRVTDAIVGTGVNTISTGTPFRDVTAFRLFDPEKVLGVRREVKLTQLASRDVIIAVANEGGFTLNAEDVEAAMRWVKSTAYQQGSALVSKEKFFRYLQDLTTRRPSAA